MATFNYYQHAEDPAYVVTWLDSDGAVIDFSSGYTFELKLVSVSAGTVALTKTTGITGAATAPNITAQWSSGELAAITPGDYQAVLTPTTSSRQRSPFGGRTPDIIRIIATPA